MTLSAVPQGVGQGTIVLHSIRYDFTLMTRNYDIFAIKYHKYLIA